MPASSRSVELGTLLAELGSGVQLLDGGVVDLGRPVTGAVVWTPGDPVPSDATTVVVCVGVRTSVQEIAPLLEADGSRVILLCGPPPDVETLDTETAGDNVVGFSVLGAGEVIGSIARSTQTADEAVSRRLGSLQRSFSLALAEPAPIPALLNRLKRVCNATTALIDRHGDITHATGPVPRGLLFGEISSANAETQAISVDGWRGLATRIPDPSVPDQHGAWLVVTSRRADFPDTQVISAVHVVASLIEASQRMGFLAQQQERAVRAAVLEQALALRRERHDAELAARVAGLGVTFDGEVRVAVVAFARPPQGEHRQQASDSLLDTLGQQLATEGHASLIAARGDSVTILVQCTLGSLHRLLSSGLDHLPPLHVGIGRPIVSVDAVVDSYHDAQLAVRTLQSVAQDRRLMAYEDFDFAIRLFADVGLDRMVSWAEEFLAPLADRENLLAGLRAYFESDQNINVAADALNIHHNSLRYRLAKVEELLSINLKQPAAVSSVFLALTAIDLTRSPGALRPRGKAADKLAVDDVVASAGATTFGSQDHGDLGVVYKER